MNKLPEILDADSGEDAAGPQVPFALPADERLPYGRGALSAELPLALVRRHLGRWTPFPARSDRGPWTSLPEDVRERLTAAADAAAREPWPVLRASSFAAFQRNGERRAYDRLHHHRRRLLRDLVLGACVVDDERYDDAVMDAVWAICEESFWGSPAHSFSRRHESPVLPAVDEPVIDLFAAETGAQLAWVRFLMEPQLRRAGGSVLLDRTAAEIERRLLTPLETRDDWFWLGMRGRGANNWTTWIAANLLVCLLLVESDPTRRAVLVGKLIAALDVYVHHMPADGGCSEGQSYWAQGPSRLVDFLEALSQASGGELDGFGLPKLRDVCRYPLALHVEGRTMVQHADGHGEWTAEPAVLHRAGRLLGDAQARQLAVHLRDMPPGGRKEERGDLWRALSELFEPGYREAPAAAAPGVGATWFRDLQVLSVREEEGSSRGFMLCAKGGHNAEYHNHNDVGGFSVLDGGRHVVVDPGSGVYTKQTFGPDRFQLWPMRSDSHGLPLIGGHAQGNGKVHAASEVTATVDADGAGMRAELAGAWPAEAGVLSYVRELRLHRARREVVVSDAWRLSEGSSVVLPLLLAHRPQLGDGIVRVDTGAGGVDILVEGAESVTVEPHPVDDPLLEASWGPLLWRVTLTPPSAVTGHLTMTFRHAS